MVFYKDAFVTHVEVPDEISLAYTITGCKLGCPLCHSKELWTCKGSPLTVDTLVKNIENQKHISCVLFMGGEYSFDHLASLGRYVKDAGLKTALYTGLTLEEMVKHNHPYEVFDYLKVGRYLHSLGGLAKPSTNQRFYKNGVDMTDVFWREERMSA